MRAVHDGLLRDQQRISELYVAVLHRSRAGQHANRHDQRHDCAGECVFHAILGRDGRPREEPQSSAGADGRGRRGVYGRVSDFGYVLGASGDRVPVRGVLYVASADGRLHRFSLAGGEWAALRPRAHGGRAVVRRGGDAVRQRAGRAGRPEVRGVHGFGAVPCDRARGAEPAEDRLYTPEGRRARHADAV